MDLTLWVTVVTNSLMAVMMLTPVAFPGYFVLKPKRDHHK